MQSMFNTRIVLRNDNTLNWLANENAVLLRGEVGVEFLDSGRVKLKVGDGVSTWSQLQYINEDVVGDKSSIDILNGVLQIVGFDAAEVGAHLTKGADGVATWVIPDTSAIDRLIDAVDTLRIDLNGVRAIVGDAATEETDATGIFALLNEKANVSDVYTRDEVYNKNEIAALISSAFKYCGSKVSYSDLPTEGQNVGDVWNIETDDGVYGIKAGDNVVWNGTSWDKLSSTIDLSGYVTKEEVAPIHLELERITKTYMTMAAANKLFNKVKYEFINPHERMLIDYKESEIRVMCPSDMDWTFQDTPSDNPNANANMHYAQFRVYAPSDDIVAFKEGDHGVIVDQLHTFDDAFAGIDEYGRKYSVLWLALANYDDTTSTWNYFGKNSTFNKYIGWDYCVEWYNANGEKVDSSAIRISLSNESCHNNVEPFYMANVVKDVSEEFAFEKETRKLSINAIEQNKIIGLAEALDTKIEAIDLAGTEVPVENHIAYIGFATDSIAGVIKSASDDAEGNATANAVYVDKNTGVGVVKTINVNSLVQDDGDVIIMNGGDASTGV